MQKETAQKITNSQKGFSPILIVVVIALLGLGFLGYQIIAQNGQTTPTPTYQPPVTKPTVSPQPRSVAPGVITQAVFAKSIDPKTGVPVSSGTVFSKTDPAINLVVSLKNPKVGIKIEYVRYLNDQFLDNRSTATTRANPSSVVFDWNLKKADAMHLIGNYKVKLYTNGVFEKEVNYKVQ